MKKNKIVIVALLAGISFLSGCKKESYFGKKKVKKVAYKGTSNKELVEQA